MAKCLVTCSHILPRLWLNYIFDGSHTRRPIHKNADVLTNKFAGAFVDLLSSRNRKLNQHPTSFPLLFNFLNKIRDKQIFRVLRHLKRFYARHAVSLRTTFSGKNIVTKSTKAVSRTLYTAVGRHGQKALMQLLYA